MRKYRKMYPLAVWKLRYRRNNRIKISSQLILIAIEIVGKICTPSLPIHNIKQYSLQYGWYNVIQNGPFGSNEKKGNFLCFFFLLSLLLLFGLSKDQPNPDQIFYVQFKFRACGLNLKLFKGVQYIWIMLLNGNGDSVIF